MNTELKVGDIVKSLDFAHIQDCYYVGLVVGVSKMDGTFRAKTIKRVWRGQEDEYINEKYPSDFFVAPLQGNMMLDDMGTRVQVIG